MSRVRKLKNGAQHLKNGASQKWNGLPNHHRLAVVVGVLVFFFLIGIGVNFLNSKLRAASLPQSLLFRAILEQGTETKYLILRGTIIGSKGKVCFAPLEVEITGECPTKFPVMAWGRHGVRTEIASDTPATGKIWLVSSEGIKSNQLEISF